jgi:predicted Fe-Mo cluster-binding NifX family protein
VADTLNGYLAGTVTGAPNATTTTHRNLKDAQERIAMKIAATSTGPDLDAAIDSRFGRCAYFVVLDSASGDLEATPNPFLDATGGAGTQAAQWVLGQDVDVLLTGRCGPKAAAVLNDAGIRVVEGVSGSVREASEGFRTEDSATREPQGVGNGRGPGRCRRAGGGRGAGNGQGNPAGGHGAGRGRGAGRGIGRHGRS